MSEYKNEPAGEADCCERAAIKRADFKNCWFGHENIFVQAVHGKGIIANLTRGS